MANKAISTLAVGSSVYLNVGGVRKEFLVVHQGLPSSLYDASCDGTWLLMKDCYENRQWNSSGENKYESSTVNTYLNGPFLSLFDSNIQGIIKQVKIPYRKNGGSGGTTQQGANGLPCKIFLLSAPEVHYELNYIDSGEGAVLSYFASCVTNNADSKRVAYLNGSSSVWGLRSPYTNSTYYVWYVYTDGNYYIGNASDSFGIRPALVLPPDAEVDSSGNVTPPPPPATHKTLVNGTVYEVKGGKCMVDGTVYNILKGRTLIDGTGWDIALPSAEPDVSKTWTFNSTVSSPASTLTILYANFTSNGTKFKAFNCDVLAGALNLSYLYLNQDASHTQLNVYYYNWQNEAYRTVTFDEAPSGDLLTWLQANATPQ